MRTKSVWVPFFLGLVALAFVGASTAQAANIKGVKQWIGTVEDAKKIKEWPADSPITNKDDFAKLWKSWNGKDELSEVDFTKQFVLVTVNTGGQVTDVTLVEQARAKGTYVSTGTVVVKKVEGFTYCFTLYNRAGIKTLNFKPFN